MRIFCWMLAILVASTCWASVIILKDGTRLEGDAKRTSDGWTITMADGSSRKVPFDAVKSIELGTAAKSSDQAASGLASLRRSVEALNDIEQIIDRYNKFIVNVKDEKTKSDAQTDLNQWIERKNRGLIKHGSKWVAPDEVAEMAQRATDMAVQARELIRQNRNRDADQLLQQALAVDPMNPAAQYLRGVALYRTDKTVDARKAFEAVNSVIPNHPPTLNNLAVILFKQNAKPAALNWYDQAMQASGVNKFILDNVAEALGSMPPEQIKGAGAKCQARFVELDVVLQRQLEPQGLYRWGGGWVNQQQLDQLRTVEKQIRDQLASLQQEFDQAKARIAAIDEQIKSNNITLADISARSWYRDGNGNYVQIQPPQIYYDLQNENTRLKTEQESLKSRMTQMQDQAKRIQQQVPVPKFTGVQQIVGVEGTPGLPGANEIQIAPPATSPGELSTSPGHSGR
jgi:Flp pilus assembly protein TadD